MTTRKVEIIVGVFVALGLAALFVLAMQVSNLSMIGSRDGYPVVAYFENIGGLKEQAPVSAAGVTVGRVSEIEYDERTFRARVTMTIGEQYNQFPTDTSASIYTSGLLGEQYIALAPGAEEQNLEAGSNIQYTQSAVVLEELIGQFLFDRAQGGGVGGAGAGAEGN